MQPCKMKSAQFCDDELCWYSFCVVFPFPSKLNAIKFNSIDNSHFHFTHPILCGDLHTWLTLICAAPPATWRPCSGTAATSTRPTGPCWTPSLSTRGCSGLLPWWRHNEVTDDLTCSGPGSASASGLTFSVLTPGRWASCLASPAWTVWASTASSLSRDWRVLRTLVTATSPRPSSGLTPHTEGRMSGLWPQRNGTKLERMSLWLSVLIMR